MEELAVLWFWSTLSIFVAMVIPRVLVLTGINWFPSLLGCGDGEGEGETSTESIRYLW